MDNWFSWLCGTLMVGAIVGGPVACTANGNAKIDAAIQRGVDPIAAKCAFSIHASPSQCVIIATKAKSAD